MDDVDLDSRKIQVRAGAKARTVGITKNLSTWLGRVSHREGPVLRRLNLGSELKRLALAIRADDLVAMLLAALPDDWQLVGIQSSDSPLLLELCCPRHVSLADADAWFGTTPSPLSAVSVRR